MTRHALRSLAFFVLATSSITSCALDGAGPTDTIIAQAFTYSDNEAQLLDAEEQEFLRLINQHRAANGLPALTATRMLDQVSYNHSADMAARNYFSHTSQDGRTFDQRMRDGEYTYNTYLGENIAAGNATGAATFEQWRNSAGHNANMLSANFRAIGIGRAYSATSTYRWYWTTDFGGVVDNTALPPSGAVDAGVTDAGATDASVDRPDTGTATDAGTPTDTGTSAYPPPVAVSGNETTTSAYTITESRAFVATGNTSNMVNNTGGSCGGSSAPDAAFKVNVTATRTVLIDTEGSGFDTVLHVRRASDGAQACNNNVSSSSLTSRLSLSLPPGLYYIWVDGNGSARGAYRLRYLPR
jgi:uncharacterized protein YkwD